MHTDAVKRQVKNRLKFEVHSYDKAFLGLNGDVKAAFKILEAGGKAGVIKVKIP
jgi:hypothetical protein